MTEKILEYKKELENVQNKIKVDLKNYLNKIDYNVPSQNFQIVEITSEKDLDKVIYGQGFYIILTDKEFEDNTYNFKYKNQRAIYRGHSYFTKKRLTSHLSNDTYNKKKKKHDPNYTVCLKIEEKINGINLNQEPFKNWKWTVIVHKMDKSTKVIREQAELAFDELYNKPCKSRE